MAEFAYNVAGLCSLIARQHARVPVLSFLDGHSRPIKRLIGDALESKFRGDYILRHLHVGGALPKLFAERFDQYVAMTKSDQWLRLTAHCATIADSPYLEQRCATAMSGIELLLRCSLIDSGHCTAKSAERMGFAALIEAARSKLGWDIPPHYTSGDRARMLRNAVAHGGPLPEAPITTVQDLQKWSLFLMRRILMRIGYNGMVASPKDGAISTSPVDDFSEAHNSFGT